MTHFPRRTTWSLPRSKKGHQAFAFSPSPLSLPSPHPSHPPSCPSPPFSPLLLSFSAAFHSYIEGGGGRGGAGLLSHRNDNAIYFCNHLVVTFTPSLEIYPFEICVRFNTSTFSPRSTYFTLPRDSPHESQASHGRFPFVFFLDQLRFMACYTTSREQAHNTHTHTHTF